MESVRTLEADEVTALADTLVALIRSFNRTRARILASAADDVEWWAQVILRTLANEGPLRASALAGAVHSDPSTVSRQVAALVKDGLIERRADPADGRASLLALTPAADAVLAANHEKRRAWFASMLEGWSESDVRRFTDLLERFTVDFDRVSSEFDSGRPFAAPAEGKH